MNHSSSIFFHIHILKRWIVSEIIRCSPRTVHWFLLFVGENIPQESPTQTNINLERVRTTDFLISLQNVKWCIRCSMDVPDHHRYPIAGRMLSWLCLFRWFSHGVASETVSWNCDGISVPHWQDYHGNRLACGEWSILFKWASIVHGLPYTAASEFYEFCIA